MATEMRRVRRWMLPLIAITMLVGCSVDPREVSRGEFDPAKISYFFDARTDVCFAVISYQRIDTGGRIGGGLSQSAVPCSAKVMALVRP